MFIRGALSSPISVIWSNRTAARLVLRSLWSLSRPPEMVVNVDLRNRYIGDQTIERVLETDVLPKVEPGRPVVVDLSYNVLGEAGLKSLISFMEANTQVLCLCGLAALPPPL